MEQRTAIMEQYQQALSRLKTTTVSVRNFRAFDKNGVSVDIAPFTILTGCNSSGKSSFVKALMMLDMAFKENIDIDLTKSPFNLLGGFSNILNKFNSGEEFSISYESYSLFLHENTTTTYSFTKSSPNCCMPKYITITNSNNCIIYEDENYSKSAGLKIAKTKHSNASNRLEFEKKQKKEFFNYVEILHLMYKKNRNLNQNSKNILNIYPGRFGNCYCYCNFNEIPSLYSDINYDSDSAFVNSLKNHINDSSTIFDHIIASQRLFKKNFIFDNSNDPYLLECENHVSLFNKSKSHNILLYFPIYEELNEIKKTDLRKYLTQSTPKLDQSSNDYKLLLEFLDEFESCEYETVLDFMRHKELEMLSSTIIHKFADNCTLDYPYYHVWTMLCSCFGNNLEPDFYIPNSLGDLSRVLDWYRDFQDLVINHAKFPLEFLQNYHHISSSRVSVQRSYDLSADTDFSRLLSVFISKKAEYQDREFAGEEPYLQSTNNQGYIAFNPTEFTNHWLQQFDIADSLKIVADMDALTAKLLLHFDKDDSDVNIADKGYGVTQLIAIFLQIELSIMNSSGFKNNKNDSFQFNKSLISIEEPEIHLHPKYQSLLGEMFVDAHNQYNINFIIETHSEYLIRRLQTLVAQKQIKPNDVSLNYFYDANPNKRPEDCPHLKKIEIEEDGRLSDTFGSGFFDEADNLAMQLLTLKVQNND